MTVTSLPRRNGALRAAIYGRASHDPKKRGRSIKDQFAVAEDECEERGWDIVGYYEDRDRSASRRATKAREDFERLVADVERGLIDVIAYAEKSRSSRNMEVSIALRSLCEKHNVLICYDGRVFDMRKSADRKEFTRDALQSEEEAENTIERAARTARLNARRGNPHGITPFGYERRYDPSDGSFLGQFPHPENAIIVAALFDQAAAGESINTLTDAYRQHVPSANRSSLRKLLRNKAYIGVRVHRGKAVSECQWDAIVSTSTFFTVQRILDAPERQVARDGSVRHLLSHLGVCASCIAEGADREAALLIMQRVKTTKNGRMAYRCPTTKGHVMMMEDRADAVVEASVFAWLGSPAASKVFRPRHDSGEADRLRIQIAGMRAQLEGARALVSEFDSSGTPRLSIESLAATEQVLLPKVAEAEKTLEQLTATADPLLNGLIGSPLEVISKVWNEQLTLPQRRHLLRTVVNVEVRPTESRRHPLPPASRRVGLTYAGEEGFVSGRRPQRGV